MIDCIKLFFQNVEKHPNSICIIDNEETITYYEFSKLVERSAKVLLEYSNNPKVIINLKQGIPAYAMILGTLLAGGYYCPLNLESPNDRKSWIINQFGPDVIVSDHNTTLPDSTFPTINVFDILHSQGESLSIHSKEYSIESLAYIIYTSGSTGDPKGVMIRRESLNAFLEWSIEEYGLTSNDLWAQYSYLSFDLSIVDIFTTLCSGACLVSINEMVYKIRPANALVKFNITVWHSVPGIVDYMIKNEKTRPANLSTVRLMSFCGEPLLRHHLDYLFEKNPDLKVFNTYGPTEGTLFCTWIQLSKDNYKEHTKHTASIGKTIPGWNFKLANHEHDESVKEVVIYGKYIGNGYVNLENGMFIEIEQDGKKEKGFITGDIFEVSGDDLFFIGRKDRQIKHKGFRIEPEEIDFWITKHTEQKSVTISHNNLLYSFVEKENIDSEDIKLYLEQHIEKYKIPAYIYGVKNLPRNANAKIDHNALKEIIHARENTY